MELYTLRRVEGVYVPTIGETLTRFEPANVIDEYESLIWTERYYGDGDVQVVLPVTLELIEKLPVGIFLGIDESDELMIVETVTIENDRLNVQGISLLSWLNNRFLRTSKSHKVREWVLEKLTPGEILWSMVYAATDPESPYMDSSLTDIPNRFLAKLPIPELGLHSYDTSGDRIDIAVPFGPLYDGLKSVATAFEMGIQIRLETNLNPFAEKALGFRAYKGINRTYTQPDDEPQNGIVRFSQDLNSLGNVKELASAAAYKTLAVGFAPNIDADLGDPEHGSNNAVVAFPKGKDDSSRYKAFDCRALQVFAEDVTGYPEPLSNVQIREIMDATAATTKDQLAKAAMINVVDGEVVPTHRFQYGRDYSLGDLVELQATNGYISTARVMEFIRVKDTVGERGYPTVQIQDVDQAVDVYKAYPKPITAYDDPGNAHLLTGDIGSFTGTNADCTTDGLYETGNKDWLVVEYSPDYESDIRNWRTAWFKWEVPTDRWTDGSSQFAAFLTDYDVHMVMMLLVLQSWQLPPDGPYPPDDPYSRSTLGGDRTPSGKKRPYPMLMRFVKDASWWIDTYDPHIWIGIATPPLGVFGNEDDDHGGRFTLHWSFIE